VDDQRHEQCCNECDSHCLIEHLKMLPTLLMLVGYVCDEWLRRVEQVASVPTRLVFVLFVYFTFLHLVSYLTINQQFGREVTKTHSDQRQVMSENGLVF
jgi:hypothetical protein